MILDRLGYVNGQHKFLPSIPIEVYELPEDVQHDIVAVAIDAHLKGLVVLCRLGLSCMIEMGAAIPEVSCEYVAIKKMEEAAAWGRKLGLCHITDERLN